MPFYKDFQNINNFDIKKMLFNNLTKKGLNSNYSIKLNPCNTSLPCNISNLNSSNKIYLKNQSSKRNNNEISSIKGNSLLKNSNIERKLYSPNRGNLKSVLPKPKKSFNSKISKGFHSVMNIYKLKNKLKYKIHNKVNFIEDIDNNINNNLLNPSTKKSLKKIEVKKNYLQNGEISENELSDLKTINKLTTSNNNFNNLKKKSNDINNVEINLNYLNLKENLKKTKFSYQIDGESINENNIVQLNFVENLDDSYYKNNELKESSISKNLKNFENSETLKTGNFGSEIKSNNNSKISSRKISQNLNEEESKNKINSNFNNFSVSVLPSNEFGEIQIINNLEVIKEVSSNYSSRKIEKYKSLQKNNGSLLYKILDNPTESNINFINNNSIYKNKHKSKNNDSKNERKSQHHQSSKINKTVGLKKSFNQFTLGNLRFTGFDKDEKTIWNQNKLILEKFIISSQRIKVFSDIFIKNNCFNGDYKLNYNIKDDNHNNSNIQNLNTLNSGIQISQNSSLPQLNETKNNLIKKANENIENNNFSFLDKIPKVNFTKPQAFFLLKYSFILSIFLILLTSLYIFYFISTTNDIILLNYEITKNFINRNIAIFELFYIFKISILNGKVIENFDVETGYYFSSFERSLNNFNTYSQIIKEYIKNDFLEKTDFQLIANIEKNLNTANFCNYFIYYNEEENLKNILADIKNINLINIDLQTINSNSEYNYKLEDCINKSGGLLNNGLSDFLNTSKYFIKNYYKDLVKFMEQEYKNSNNKSEILKEKIKEIFNDTSLLKIYLNINDKIYNLNRIYFKIFTGNNSYMYKKFRFYNDLVEYSLFSVLCLISVLYLILIKFIIDKPLGLILDCETFIKNSILFNTLEI